MNINRFYDKETLPKSKDRKNYTAMQWLWQSKKWAQEEGHTEFLNKMEEIEKEFESKVLATISEYWPIEFRKTNKNTIVRKQDIFDFNRD